MPIVKFSKKIKDIVSEINPSDLKGKVGIKVHFGEDGNETYLNPEIAKEVYNKVTELGFDSVLIECNVLYKGSRTNSKSHIETAKKHGFGFAPIDILDGEKGEESIVLEVKGGKIKTAKIGKGIERYDSMIVLSHFKGHGASGFGGAFKNLGMGLGSRAGKLDMHSDISPSIDEKECVACDACFESCNFKAIEINSTAKINPELCTGCAICIAVCKFNAVKIPWGGSSNKELQEKIVDYSKSIIDYLAKKIIYINVLENITESCDCLGVKMKPIMEDVGILISDDPVAIDKASLDLANEKSNDRFDKINMVDKDYKVFYAQKVGLGNKNYQLEEILS